ncbi:DNA primase family protein [Bacillus cereus]|uniref:DNA primase family protein n=1 Tax=Bacillus cereus TaxID=1396 RepID=UPI0015961AC2|nr:phage/plasmid primase, P4 family [Bacillus cereus]
MVKVSNDFQDIVRKKIKELPINLVPDEYLYDHELSDLKDCKYLSKVSFNIIPEDYLREHEINFEPGERIKLHDLEYGELDDQFLADNSLDEEQSKVWDIVSQDGTTEKLNGNNIKDETQKDSNNKNIEYDIYSKILDRYILKCLKGSLYLYNSSKGCFFELEEYQIRTLVRSGWSDKVERLLSKCKVDDIIDRLKSSEAIQIKEDDLDPYSHLINFSNCVLDIRTGRELNHSPKYRFTSFINANYYTHRTEGKHFLQFIDQCAKGDKQKIMQIQELIGYTISNYTNAKKWFALIGAPHTGKSTILEVLTEIVGEDYTSNVPLHELSGRFSLSDLFKKKLNVCGELNDNTLKNINTIKALTGNDRLRADIKYKSAINFINKAKIIMAGNAMPQLQTLDNTTAFTDRILFVVFNNTIPEGKRDYKLKEKLLSEKDYIVQWAVEGLERLISNNFIFTECRDSIEFKTQYQNEMSNINDFISVMCKIEPNNDECRVHKRDLYTAYISFGRDNCQSILSKKDFFNEIKKLPIKQSKFRYRKSTPLDGFIGITLKRLTQENEQ